MKYTFCLQNYIEKLAPARYDLMYLCQCILFYFRILLNESTAVVLRHFSMKDNAVFRGFKLSISFN